MAHNSKRNKRHTINQDSDDYLYPTKKIRNQTRSRRRDRNLIKAGLIDINNPEVEETVSLDEEMIDDYNEMIIEFNDAEEDIFIQDDVDDFYERIDEEERIENEEGNLLDNINTDWDRRWEDY